MKVILFLSFGLVVSATSFGAVTLSSLLEEMADATAVTRFPEPTYSIRGWSSYDRKSVSPELDGWFANQDWNNFIRAEGREGVMVDAKGPGAVVRIWCAGVKLEKCLIRLYLDGTQKPTFEGLLFDLIGGTALCGEPLSFRSAKNPNNPLQCGMNLILPIPYAKSCKMTFESRQEGSRFWYNVETRAYPSGTAVETLTPGSLAAVAPAIQAAGAKLTTTEPSSDASASGRTHVLAPGQTAAVSHSGGSRGRMIRQICLRLDDGADVALEQVSVEIACDGRTTIRMPLGAFFGTGPWERTPYRTRLAEVRSDGMFINRMLMPYRQSFELRLVNRAEKTVKISGLRADSAAYDWTEGRSMHLTADYVRRRGIPTVKDGKDYDLTFDRVSGKGVLAGTMVFVDNPSTYAKCPWWGEGDEKIFVDGEKFPSVFGTGTEDYFNYAWSRPEPFAWPFCAQPSGAGNLAVGKSANFRWRALDALPFAKSLTFDMEMWHWDKKCTVDYDSVSWRYLVPPGS